MLERLKFWKRPTPVTDSAITPEHLRKMYESIIGAKPPVELGDGKAEFLGEGSEEEYKEQVNEDKGWKGIFGIGK